MNTDTQSQSKKIADECPSVSVLFFSYNRPRYLDLTINAFLKKCSYSRKSLELIVCDDGSKAEHADEIHEIASKHKVDKILMREHQGMGASFNAGIRAATGDYLLHLEDDWELYRDAMFLQSSIAVMQKHPDIAAMRFYKLRNFKMDAETELCRTQTCYGTVNTLELRDNLNTYSNNPHLKPRDFHNLFGWYREGIAPDETERDFCRRFLEQSKWRIHLLGVCFKHIGHISTNGLIWHDVPKLNPG